jgi:hypothetical protein
METKLEVTCECEKDLQTAAQELRDSLGGNCLGCEGTGYCNWPSGETAVCSECEGSGIAPKVDVENEGDRTARDYADAEAKRERAPPRDANTPEKMALH